MRQLEGRTAIVTGAGSGIGLGLARTFARHGMAVALCDIRGDRLDAALADVQSLGRGPAIAVITDVSDRASVRHAAEQAVTAFGTLHVACNNAGVTIHGRSIADLSPSEWDWTIGVNLHGVIHGIETFLPLIRSHGQEGHIVNTASIAGFNVRGERRSGAYAATKFAVVALTESLAYDLADTPIGASVLAPAAVRTHIYVSGENRPDRFGGPYEEPGNNPFQKELETGLEPDQVGERVVEAIRRRELYVFTHMETRDWLLARHRRIIDAFDACERWNATLAGSVPPQGSAGSQPA
ncbi:MAG TPA: SDR family NAD(P)-dependent oxidoreductase [Hyphomicrobiaceae bacterium]|nr:SDR family NAD(P)-dependent oxidoreductase [Hyphomicrobiaceae bacterium]